MTAADKMMELKLKELQRSEPKMWRQMLRQAVASAQDGPADTLMMETVQDIWEQLPGAEEALERLLKAVGAEEVEEMIPTLDLIGMLYPEEAAESNLRELMMEADEMEG